MRRAVPSRPPQVERQAAGAQVARLQLRLQRLGQPAHLARQGEVVEHGLGQPPLGQVARRLQRAGQGRAARAAQGVQPGAEPSIQRLRKTRPSMGQRVSHAPQAQAAQGRQVVGRQLQRLHRKGVDRGRAFAGGPGRRRPPLPTPRSGPGRGRDPACRPGPSAGSRPAGRRHAPRRRPAAPLRRAGARSRPRPAPGRRRFGRRAPG